MIAELIKGSAVLTNLNLAINEVGVEGAKALASMLEGNEVLTKLDAQYNNLTNDGKEALCEAVKGRDGFELLLLSF